MEDVSVIPCAPPGWQWAVREVVRGGWHRGRSLFGLEVVLLQLPYCGAGWWDDT